MIPSKLPHDTTSLNDLTHASRDGHSTLCGKAVHPSMCQSKAVKPKMVWFDEWTKKFWAIPTCRTCREQISESELKLEKEKLTYK